MLCPKIETEREAISTTGHSLSGRGSGLDYHRSASLVPTLCRNIQTIFWSKLTRHLSPFLSLPVNRQSLCVLDHQTSLIQFVVIGKKSKIICLETCFFSIFNLLRTTSVAAAVQFSPPWWYYIPNQSTVNLCLSSICQMFINFYLRQLKWRWSQPH